MTVSTQTLPTLLLSVDETQHALRASRTKVYELLKTGQIVGIKIGKRRLVTMESIGAFIADQVQANVRPGGDAA